MAIHGMLTIEEFKNLVQTEEIETVIVVLLNNSTARIENLTLASWLRSALTVFEVIGMSLLVGTILF